ncbi:glycine cleavage system aminomethyltransferase GcvT, partial [bacterium]|nr:glycine cleavage system aminomethyltransferase GcvT [bacterium]
LNDNGGIIDDLTIYCMDPGKEYMLCVNASNTANDVAWIRSLNAEGAAIDDRSPAMSLLALQGPEAARILSSCLGFDPDALRYYTFASVTSTVFGEVMVSKTGYTGAGGVELFLDNGKAPLLWKALVEKGAVPCGLGARDTLRLEMGFPLHGNDIDETTTPLEAGLAFAVDFSKPDFIGRKSLEKQTHDGLKKHLWGLKLKDKGIPRQGCMCMKDEREIGIVTSGSISPVLGTGIALAYLDRDIRKGDEVDIVVRSKKLKATVMHPPFVDGAASK